MQINRNQPRSGFRVQRRRSGCLLWVCVLGMMVGTVFVSRSWWTGWFRFVDTGQVEGDMGAAQQALERGDLDKAVEIARQLWRTSPNNTDVLELLIRALIYRSYHDYDREIDRDVALQLTTAALRRLPDDPQVRTLHAYALQANGQPIEAAEIARDLLRRDPENTLARVTLGLSFGSVGGYENALKENRNTAAIAVDYAMDVQRALAISLGDTGQYRAAIDAVEGAIAINNKLAMLHFERALYAMQLGDADTATSSYFRILAFDPDNIKAKLRMCTLSSLLRESDTALQYCNEVVEHAPGWVDAWYYLGRERYLRGEFSQAQSALNRCTTLSVAQDIPIIDRQFECWYLQGQSAEILGDCESLVAIHAQYQSMAAAANLPQTWTYPPEGPPICTVDVRTP